MKKLKEKSVNDEAVSSIPPHTVEELSTAVHKKPKGNTMEDMKRKLHQYLHTQWKVYTF